MPASAPEIVAVGVLVQDGRVLLVQQRKPSALGLWGAPGGHLEPGETPHQALVREMVEEVGLTVTGAEHLRTDRRPDGFEHRAYLVQTTGEIALARDELLGFGWFTLEQIEQMRPLLRAPFIVDVAREAFVAAAQ